MKLNTTTNNEIAQWYLFGWSMNGIAQKKTKIGIMKSIQLIFLALIFFLVVLFIIITEFNLAKLYLKPSEVVLFGVLTFMISSFFGYTVAVIHIKQKSKNQNIILKNKLLLHARTLYLLAGKIINISRSSSSYVKKNKDFDILSDISVEMRLSLIAFSSYWQDLNDDKSFNLYETKKEQEKIYEKDTIQHDNKSFIGITPPVAMDDKFIERKIILYENKVRKNRNFDSIADHEMDLNGFWEPNPLFNCSIETMYEGDIAYVELKNTYRDSMSFLVMKKSGDIVGLLIDDNGRWGFDEKHDFISSIISKTGKSQFPIVVCRIELPIEKSKRIYFSVRLVGLSIQSGG